MSGLAGGGRGWWRLAGCFLLVLCLRAETLTIATYNVENYVTADRMVDGTYRQAYPKPESAKDSLRSVLRGMKADIVAFQEMGPRPYLEELRRDLAREGLDYPNAELLEAADADRHVAVLSRRPFSSVRAHTDLKFKYFGAEEPVKRGLLEIRFQTEAGEVALFIVHLKSRYTDRPDDPQSALRRAGEATAVRDRILQQFPDPASSRFLIVGDCNDGPASKPLRLLVQRGKTEIAEILPARDSRGESWTHFYRKEDSYSRVDYVLISPGLLSSTTGRSTTVYDIKEVAAASDHRPVAITLSFEKKR